MVSASRITPPVRSMLQLQLLVVLTLTVTAAGQPPCCHGDAWPCGRLGDESMCAAQEGCAWTADGECVGAPRYGCGAVSDDQACERVLGCGLDATCIRLGTAAIIVALQLALATACLGCWAMCCAAGRALGRDTRARKGDCRGDRGDDYDGGIAATPRPLKANTAAWP